MYRPMLLTAPASLPVTVAEAMQQCRIDADSLDETALGEVTALLTGYIKAATGHIDGWAGILGGCVVEQTWQQDYDRFGRCMRLALGPVIAIDSVTWRDDGQVEDTVADANYTLQTDDAGSYCRFRNGFAFPSGLDETAAVSIAYRAGYAAIPDPIKQAILLMVGAWYENREESVIGVSVASIPHPVAVDRLIAPLRKIEI